MTGSSPGLAALADRAMTANIPLQAQLEVTERCHLDCVHCYLDIKNPNRDEMTLSEIERVLDQLAEAGSLFLTITGGEIFLRKDIFDIIAAARRRRFAVKLYTTGTLLDRGKVARIAELAPAVVEISIYSGKSDAHAGITRRPGSLRKSLRAAVLLRQADVPVVIKTPVLAGTGDGHLDLVDIARRIGAGYKLDPSLVSRRDGGGEPLAATPSSGSLAQLFADPRINPHPGPLPPPRPDDEAPCAIARRVVRIAPNGDVFACNVFPIPAGNLRSQTFSQVWNHSPVLEEIRSISNRDLEGECRGCARQGYCGRCSSQALLEHGNFRGPQAGACERARAREHAAGTPPPAGAREMNSPDRKGRRTLNNFVPVHSLRR